MDSLVKLSVSYMMQIINDVCSIHSCLFLPTALTLILRNGALSHAHIFLRTLSFYLSSDDLICNEALFSKLCTLLYETEPEVGQLLESGEWTLFAPQDSAFDVPDVAAILADLGPKELKRITKFHAVEGRTVWPWDLACTETLAMYSGDVSRTRCEKDTATGLITKYQKGNGNYNLGVLPKLELPSLRACNGIVHVLDMVMLPVGGKTATAITEAEEVGDDGDDDDDDDDEDDADLSKSEYESFAVEDEDVDLSKSNPDRTATAAMINCPVKAGAPTDGTSCVTAKPKGTKKMWSGDCTYTALNTNQDFETTTTSVCNCSTDSGLMWDCSVVASSVQMVEETDNADLSKSNSDGAASAKMINCPGKAGPPIEGTSCASAKPTWTKKNASWSGQCTNTAWNIDQQFETTTKSVCDCSTATNLIWGCSVISSIVPIVGTPSPDGDGSWCPAATPANNDKCPLPSSYTSGECSWSMSTWYDGPNGMGGYGGYVVETTDCTCTKDTPFFACTQSAVAK